MSNYAPTSPYAATPHASWHIGPYKHRQISAHQGDRRIVITDKYTHRPDLLSFDLYGSPAYWWVFLVRNMNIIRDPIWDFEPGKEIFVPSADHLRSVVG
jgi:hypothetical protein